MSQKRAKQIRKAAKMVSAKTNIPERELVKTGKRSVNRFVHRRVNPVNINIDPSDRGEV